MKVATCIFILLAAICAVFAYRSPVQRPGPATFPTFPGQGTFNPKVGWPYPLPNPRY
ncbi:PREDICTED: abaecin-like [Habropoda laboriosa]|uniref:abaecin-like n=1 Tax=Habropoda laboriosa TaxID=597456 RepID=UPI00083D43E1|nr:PREDICTED: abaecin-like [Habropoda laboriosa]